jgi:hypothetical protein
MNTSIVYRSKLFKSEQDKLFQKSDQSMAQQSKTPIVYKSKLFKNSELFAKQQSVKQEKPAAYKSFCKVCQDSGKTEPEYTSHNVRDKCGKTMCPTLLALECRNCFKKGHTVKYCPLLQQQVKAEAKDLARAAYEPVKPKAAPKSKNVFMILESDSEEEEEEAPVVALAPTPVTNQKPGLNYSRIIDQVNNPDAYAKAKEAEMRLKAAAADAERKAREARMSIEVKKCAWADAESDEDDDEDEDDDDKEDQKEQSKTKVGVVDNSAW